MTIFEVPTRSVDQSLRISLAGKTYVFRIYWNRFSLVWVLDIASEATVPLVSGIPLVTGVNLLSPFPYLNVGGGLYVQTDGSPDTVPGPLDLGVSGHLYFVPDNG